MGHAAAVGWWVLEGNSRRVDSGGTVVSSQLLTLERAATFDTLHFLATSIADSTGSLGPRPPLLDTLAVLVAAWLAALTTDALAGSVLRRKPSSSDC